MQANFSFVRTMRLLRPLRSLSHMPGMSVLVGSIMKSLAPLANVVFFCMSIFFVFSILCLQLWSDLEYPECGRLLCDEHRGVVKFDNIGWTFITIFQCMTLEGWTEIMYATDDAWDGPSSPKPAPRSVPAPTVNATGQYRGTLSLR